MNHTQLENKLKKDKILYNLLPIGIAVAAGTMVAICGFVLNNRAGVIFCGVVAAIALLSVFYTLRIKIKSADIEGVHITYYKFIYAVLYVDGEERDRLSPFNVGKIGLEAKIAKGLKIQIIVDAFNPKIVFSDGRAPILL